MIVVLTGGTGGAKFVDGLRQVVSAKELTIIVNTGDDLEWWGLYVSPDLDSITYVLAGVLSKERGWGVKGDTFFCLQAMGELGEPIWFHTGDRDLAVHLLRSKLLTQGKTLTEVTAEIAAKMGVQARILPMSDSRVETRVDTPVGELSFEEYFVQRWFQDPVKSVRLAGAADAEPAPGVIDAIMSASVVLLAPSNPVTSIGPILAVPGITNALKQTRAPVAAVSPIVGGARGFRTSWNFDGFPRSASFHRRNCPGLPGIPGHSGCRYSRCPARGRVATVGITRSLRQHRHEYARRKGCACAPGALAGLRRKRSPRRLGPVMILVPVKSLANAKQRLASIADQSARTELAQAMLFDVA